MAMGDLPCGQNKWKRWPGLIWNVPSASETTGTKAGKPEPDLVGVSYSYGAMQAHAVTTVGSYTQDYDANGNMTERNNATGSQVLTWNMSNQLARVEGIGGSYTDTTTFVYDGDGKRVAKTAGTTTTVYPNRYYEKTGSEGTSNYYLGDRLVAVKKGSVLEYIHQDHLGSSNVSSDSGGAQKSTNTYLPFGGARSSSGTLGTDKKFTGQRLDGTGLYFYNARYYDPEIGRFISPDTVIPDPFNPQALNRYSYVYNNPLSYTDPSGHLPKWMQKVVDRVKTNGLNALQATLDFAGLAPGVGEPADVINGYIYTARGDAVNAGISFSGAVPFVGWAAIIGKYLRKFGKSTDSLRGAKTWGRPETLAEHFGEHGADFGAKDVDEYAQMASDFLKRAQADKLPTKMDEQGIIRVYDPETNTFAVYNPDGSTATFYKPDPKIHGYASNQEYWEHQKGVSPWEP